MVIGIVGEDEIGAVIKGNEGDEGDNLGDEGDNLGEDGDFPINGNDDWLLEVSEFDITIEITIQLQLVLF